MNFVPFAKILFSICLHERWTKKGKYIVKTAFKRNFKIKKMSYDISDIKKLPVEERLEIIDEILETCVAESPDSVYEDDEKLKSVLEERVTDYESGRMKAIQWDEFIAGLKGRQKGFNYLLQPIHVC